MGLDPSFEILVNTVERRLSENQYVPLATEGYGILKVVACSGIICIGMSIEAFEWYTAQTNDFIQGRQITLVGAEVAVEGVKDIIALPTIAAQSAGSLLSRGYRWISG